MVGRFAGCQVEIVCEWCGRGAELTLASAPSRRTTAKFSPGLRFHEWETKLRCRLGPKPCGGPGKILRVTGWKDGGDGFSGPAQWWRGLRGR